MRTGKEQISGVRDILVIATLGGVAAIAFLSEWRDGRMHTSTGKGRPYSIEELLVAYTSYLLNDNAKPKLR